MIKSLMIIYIYICRCQSWAMSFPNTSPRRQCKRLQQARMKPGFKVGGGGPKYKYKKVYENQNYHLSRIMHNHMTTNIYWELCIIPVNIFQWAYCLFLIFKYLQQYQLLNLHFHMTTNRNSAIFFSFFWGGGVMAPLCPNVGPSLAASTANQNL